MGILEDLEKSRQETENRQKVNMLQLIRARFTAGRPRKADTVDPSVIGPMFSVSMASNERDKIRDFIREQGEAAENYIVKVFVVTFAPGTGQKTWDVPEGLAEIVALADKIMKIKGVNYAGLLVSVHDNKRSAVVRYVRSFIVSQEASESLAKASLEQRFELRR